MSIEARRFKKGDLVTRIASYDQNGTVFVQHFIVASWGAKQATLKHVDSSRNALFRTYTKSGYALQGTHSWEFVLTSQYTDELALKIAAIWIADEIKRIKDRLAFAENRFTTDPAGCSFGNYTAQNYIEWERDHYAREIARQFVPAVRHGYEGR